MTNPTNTRRPTSHIAPFGVRMQPDLKAKLEGAAVSSGRSLNAEIVERLERSFFEAPLSGLSVEDVKRVTEHVVKSLYTDFVPREELEKALAERNALAHGLSAAPPKRIRKPAK